MTKSFKPMKAADADLEQLTFPYLLTPKYDGLRAVVTAVGVLTNSLKKHPNKFVQQRLRGLVGLDGELVVGDPFGEDVFRRSATIRKADGEPDFKFIVFDDFTKPDMPAVERYAMVLERVNKLDNPHVVVAPAAAVGNMGELKLWEQRYLAIGYEGVMLRAPKSPYKFGRATAKENYLLKVKPFTDAEAEIIDVVEQQANTNEATRDEMGRTKRSSAKAGKVGKQTMGALRVRGVNGRFKGVEFEIGTGFNDALRKEVFDRWPYHRNQYITYKFQDIGGYEKPRIPVFLRFRPKNEVELD